MSIASWYFQYFIKSISLRKPLEENKVYFLIRTERMKRTGRDRDEAMPGAVSGFVSVMTP